MIIETEGIVLKQVKAINGRKMLTIFTPKYGKISCATNIAPNKKSKSNLYASPFSYSKYNLFKGREMYSLNSGEVIESYYEIGEDYDKYLAASYALELSDKILLMEDPNPKIFLLLKDFLYEIKNTQTKYDTILIAYIVKIISCLGIMPNLNSCCNCDTKDNINTFFSVSGGGIICDSCAKNAIQNNDNQLIYETNFGIVETLRYLEKEPFSRFTKIALNDDVSKKLKEILIEYLKYHLDIGELKTEKLEINL